MGHNSGCAITIGTELVLDEWQVAQPLLRVDDLTPDNFSDRYSVDLLRANGFHARTLDRRHAEAPSDVAARVTRPAAAGGT
jgi:hypothetical protein